MAHNFAMDFRSEDSTAVGSERHFAIMGVVTDGAGGALVSDTTTRAPGGERETEGAENEVHSREMETTPITEEREPGGKARKPLDNNIYSTKKTVAQGMMDLALLTANASQLKLLLKHTASVERKALFVLHVSCICISIILQIIVGVLLILNSRYNINRPSHQSRADIVNNLSVIGIFLITVVNVLASSFNDSS